jgi:hypothetical protein
MIKAESTDSKVKPLTKMQKLGVPMTTKIKMAPDATAKFEFWSIDDSVKITVNGEEAGSSNIVRHGQPPKVFDITAKLRDGKNTVVVEAKNGPGWGALMGTLSTTDGFTHTFNYLNPAAPKNQVFLTETFELERQPVELPEGHVTIVFDTVNDKVSIAVNDNEPLEQGLLLHGQGPKQYDLTERLKPGRNLIHVTAVNTHAQGELIGSIQVGGVKIHEWERGEHTTGTKGVFVQETIPVNL